MKEFQSHVISGPSAIVDKELASLAASNCACSCACGSQSGGGTGGGGGGGGLLDLFSCI